jgi:hypothetical protein
VTDEDKHYSLVVKDGACQLQEGDNPDANCTLVLDSETLSLRHLRTFRSEALAWRSLGILMLISDGGLRS